MPQVCSYTSILALFLYFVPKMQHPLGYNPGQNILPLKQAIINQESSNSALYFGILNQTLTRCMNFTHSLCSMQRLIKYIFLTFYKLLLLPPPPPIYNVGIEPVVVMCSLGLGCVLEKKPKVNPNIVRGGRGRGDNNFCEVATIFCPRLYPKIHI